MDQRPRPGDRSQILTLQRLYAGVWLFLGLFPPLIAVLDRPGPVRYAASALLAVLALSYTLVRAFPRNRVVRPHTFLCVLALGLGGMSYLLGGGAAMFIVSLPHFWILAASPRQAIAISGAAAALTTGAGIAGHAWSEGTHTGNAVFTLIGYAAGVLGGLWAHRAIAQRDERARRLSAELDGARLELARAHQRQGAAEERERMAREIHDTLAQGFASIVVLAEAARAGIGTDPGRSAQQLLSIERTARENLAEARVLVGSAPPGGGTAAGSVAAALRRTLDRFAEDTGLAVDADLPEVDCAQQTRIALLRCTQESLANVRKHAAASAVGVVLARHPHGVELEITDDGRGFTAGEGRGFGLDGMRRRLAELGGELTVTSSPGDGTRVLAAIPLDGRD
jgi:signal transduction histidine kinase